MKKEVELTIDNKQQKKKKYVRIGLFVIVDIITMIISAMVPLLLRFGIFSVEKYYFELTVKYLPIDIVIAIVVIAM